MRLYVLGNVKLIAYLNFHEVHAEKTQIYHFWRSHFCYAQIANSYVMHHKDLKKQGITSEFK